MFRALTNCSTFVFGVSSGCVFGLCLYDVLGSLGRLWFSPFLHLFLPPLCLLWVYRWETLTYLLLQLLLMVDSYDFSKVISEIPWELFEYLRGSRFRDGQVRSPRGSSEWCGCSLPGLEDRCRRMRLRRIFQIFLYFLLVCS